MGRRSFRPLRASSTRSRRCRLDRPAHHPAVVLGHGPGDLEPVLEVQVDRRVVALPDGEHDVGAQIQDYTEQHRPDAYLSIGLTDTEPQDVDEWSTHTIAEDVARELFIYVEQPTGAYLPLIG